MPALEDALALLPESRREAVALVVEALGSAPDTSAVALGGSWCRGLGRPDSDVDLALYYRLSEAVVCYRCDTVYRDARPGPRQKAFDLLKHDVLKYGKSWEPNE